LPLRGVGGGEEGRGMIEKRVVLGSEEGDDPRGRHETLECKSSFLNQGIVGKPPPGAP